MPVSSWVCRSKVERRTLHATTVAVDGKAVVITGQSGSGKSGLALQLMALGAVLVADDRTIIDAELHATCPETIRGMIEARGVGILNAPWCEANVALVVDLDTTEADRLPPIRHTLLLGRDVPLLHKVESVHFPAAIVHYLRYGRRE